MKNWRWSIQGYFNLHGLNLHEKMTIYQTYEWTRIVYSAAKNHKFTTVFHCFANPASSASLSFAVPPWLTNLTQKICEDTGLFPSPINHVLINEYLPNQGIMVCTEHQPLFVAIPLYFLHSVSAVNFSCLVCNINFCWLWFVLNFNLPYLFYYEQEALICIVVFVAKA